jgi:hypothetical protein
MTNFHLWSCELMLVIQVLTEICTGGQGLAIGKGYLVQPADHGASSLRGLVCRGHGARAEISTQSSIIAFLAAVSLNDPLRCSIRVSASECGGFVTLASIDGDATVG